MSSERELDEGIKSIKSAWRREHTARANLEKMLEQAEAENAKLRDENVELRRKLGSSIDSRSFAERRLGNLSEQYDRLLEFAGHVLYCTTMTDGCGDNCPHSSSDCGHECHLREQGRKLGVEA